MEEIKTYQMSDKELVNAYKNSEEPNKEIVSAIVSRFARMSVPNEGDTNDELFAENFSNFVNGKMNTAYKVADRMANEHRYLQNEMAKVCFEYLARLASNYEKGYYDPRNEWACKIANNMIVSALQSDMFPFTYYYNIDTDFSEGLKELREKYHNS